MSETHKKEGPPIGDLHEVRATFDDPNAMQSAVAELERSGFDRADLSLPETIESGDHMTPETSAKPVDTEEDARQARTLHTSGAAASVGLAAAGVVIATGGAAAAAVGAAVVGAGVAGGVAYALTSASNDEEQLDREAKAASGALVLSVRAPTAAKREEAQAVLRASGGRDVGFA